MILMKSSSKSKKLIPFSFEDRLKYEESKSYQEKIERENKLLKNYQTKLTGIVESYNSQSLEKFILVKLVSDNIYNTNWLINVDEIKEATKFNQISRIGFTNPYVVGISNFRGTVSTIIDMNQLLLRKSSGVIANSVVLLKQNVNIALLWPKIEKMTESNSLLEVNEKDIPNFKKARLSKRVFKSNDGLLWNEIDIDKLLSSKEIIDALNIR